MKTGAELIAEERARHAKLGWTAEHDDLEHVEGDLALAAICYAAPERVYLRHDFSDRLYFRDPWPWDEHFDRRPHDGNVLKKPTRRQRIRLLAKAGSFLAAEIDRLQRLKP
jgi:hypothetical protein